MLERKILILGKIALHLHLQMSELKAKRGSYFFLITQLVSGRVGSRSYFYLSLNLLSVLLHYIIFCSTIIYILHLKNIFSNLND